MFTVTAFVAKSFAEVDQPKVRVIENLLTAFKPMGLLWDSAERAEIESVSQKVQKMISERDVFVGVFTHRHPIYAPKNGLKGHYQALLGKRTIEGWTCPPWLLQESGYALALQRRLILFRELGVEISR